MSKLSVPSWREPSTFVPGLCATIATFGIAVAAFAGPPNCPNELGGDCFTETPGVAGCAGGECCALVCAIEPFCCTNEWDFLCVDLANQNCDTPCNGTALAHSNVTNFTGFGSSSTQGSMITADDILPDTGGLVAEISFSLVNLDLAAPNGPTGDLTNGVVTIVLINGTGSFTAPIYPDDAFAEIEVDLTGLFDNSVPGADPLGAGDGVVLTLEFLPEDGLFIPPGFFWAGIRPESAVWENIPAGGNGSINHLGQLIVDPPDAGASNDVFWRQGFGLAFFGGNPVANFGWEFVVACGPGACCFEDGTCDDQLDQDGCETAGGVFAGAGFTCDDVLCAAVGACCLADGTCVDGLFQVECEELFGGTYQGENTVCANVNCPAPCTISAGLGTAEGELCGQNTNGGCNSDTQTDFGAIACGGSVEGTGWADGGTRDTDWYLIDVPAVDGTGSTRVNVSIESNFPADCFMLDVTDCAAVTLPDAENNGVNSAGDCTVYSYSVCVPVGQYAIFVGAAVEGGPLFEGVPCGGANDYRVSVECKTCDEAPGCPQDCVTTATFQPPPDGIVDGADLANLLGSWSPSPCDPNCCADTVTSATFQPPPDGIVNGADLAALLGAWGNPGCQP